MFSHQFQISESKTVNLRLTSKHTVALEEALGMSPIQALMENQQVPKLSTLILILHGCLQSLEHGYTVDKTFELYDEYVDNGGDMMSLVMALIEVFKISGFFKEVPKAEEQAKVTPIKKPTAKK